MPDTRRHPDDRLRLTRLARGQSQGDLARAAGITRQAISGIESGRWSPSLEVALAVARALDSSVEDLFGEAAEAPSVSGRLAVRPVRQQGSTAPKRLLLSEVAGDTVAFPLSRDGSLVPGFVPALGVMREGRHEDTSAAGTGDARTGDANGTERDPVAGKRGRNRHGTFEALRIAETAPTLAIAGCDPALALLQGPLQRHSPPVGLVWWPCGNTMALELLEAGSVHAAAIHRGVEARQRHRPGVEAVGFASWREGLALAPRHRGTVKDLRDVVAGGLRIANRERGSEARRLLDDQLARLGIEASDVAGYETECTAHLLVASAVGSGLADAAVMTEPAALAFGLEFVPWQEEISELHIPRSLMGGIEMRALLDVLGGRELPRQLAALEGYDAEPCGRILAA
ncbi:MAG: substrate-binding domain-containing protein [Acidimicrobiales bacterium]